LPASGLNLAAPLSSLSGLAPLASPSFTGRITAGSETLTGLLNAPLIGTDASGNFVPINLGTNLSISSGTLNATGGGGGGSPVTWPSSGTIIISNGTNTPSSLAPVSNTIIYATGGAWTTLAPQANSVLVYNGSLVPSASTTLPSGLTIPGYLTGNQNIILTGDFSGSGATAITGVVNKVNGMAYPAVPALNTVPVVTSGTNVSYFTAAQLAGTSGFGSMLQQSANAVAITGGSIIGTTISGASNTISNIANASLTNSSMTLAGHSVALGGTQAFAIGDLSNIATGMLVGNNSGSSGPPLALGTAAVSTMLGLGTMSTQAASAVAITGGTINGPSVTGLPTPSGATDAATKAYVDATSSGTNLHPTVAAATAVAVLPNTPTTSGAGVGKTIQSSTNSALVVDGYTVLLNDRVLVKDQATASDNGIYLQTQLGTGAAHWILTRATDFDQAVAGEVALGAEVLVINGTVNTGKAWQLGAPTPASITVDTTALTFNLLSSPTVDTADETTIHKAANQFSALPNGILSAINSTTSTMLYKTGTVWAGITPVNSAVLVTSGAGVPSESTTLPIGLTIPGYLTGNQSITLSGAVSGSGATAITTTLASVADGSVLSNLTGGSAAPSANSLSAVMDHDIGSTVNNIVFRGSSTYGLVAAVNNALLVTNGTGVPSESTTLPGGLTTGTLTLGGALTATGQTITGGTYASSTLTTPTINGAALSGTLSGTPTFSGNLTFSGVPIYSGLSSGTCSSGTALDASNNVIKISCPGTSAATVTTGIAAAGTTQGTATTISSQQNYVATGANCASFPTCSGSAGVILNASLVSTGAHDVYVVNEDATNALVMYPPSGDTIDNLAANTPVYIQANQTAHLIFKSSSAVRLVP
jgi:hypothetical protein